MTAAICLVIGRNADAVHTPEIDHPRKPISHPPLHLVSLQEGESLVLQDWTYLVIPDLSIYKIPFPNLIQAVRKALLSLSRQAKRIEVSWSAVSNRQPPSPRINSLLRHSNKVVEKSHLRAHHIRRLRPPFRPSNHQ
ncbi:hypothetical protein L210DRAFT_3519331 [Boletus edulis BED1]|uniref:Uncharacterized protein n=1 Tax=Boletus edulis BED1 TaxID=1328754 RepID=A0AAD4CAD4_BOLED|nr:hypothetical protein L210DRAFT_3519331 [Boletus edulis BED1]